MVLHESFTRKKIYIYIYIDLHVVIVVATKVTIIMMMMMMTPNIGLLRLMFETLIVECTRINDEF